jgi:hypothetical protein
MAVLTPADTYEGPVRPYGDPVEDEPSLKAIRAAKDGALDRGDFEAAASFRVEERELLRGCARAGPNLKPVDRSARRS